MTIVFQHKNKIFFRLLILSPPQQYRWKVQLVLFVVTTEEQHHEVNIESEVDFDIARVELSRYRGRFQCIP